MKIIPFILIPLVLFFGCIEFETYSVHLWVDEDQKTDGRIEVIYGDIYSNADSLKDQQADFKELIQNWLNGDRYLLDQVESGIFIKTREITATGGRLDFKFSGIYRNLKVDGNPLRVTNDGFRLVIKNKDVSVASTNAQVVTAGDSLVFTWPVDSKELVFNLNVENSSKKKGKFVSFSDEYKKWKSGVIKF
jgi:hypothetical protein